MNGVTERVPGITDRVSRWVMGTEEPDSLASFLAREGRVFRNWRLALWQNDFAVDGHALDTEGVARRAMERRRYISQLGFAIPTREAIDLLSTHAPLVEIGAGTAMWSALLALRGVDIVATDAGAPGECGDYGFVVGAHHPTKRLEGKTAIRRYRDRNVFCSWPTYAHTWFRQAARAMRIGRRLIVVREDATAEDTAWDYIDRAFELETSLEIPCFERMHDRIEVWLKKREVRRSAIDAAPKD